MTLADYAYVVVADWPKYGRQIWRAGVYDTENEARAEFAAYRSTIKDGTPMLVEVRRIEVTAP